MGNGLQLRTLHLQQSVPPAGYINREPFSEAVDCIKELSMSLQSCSDPERNVRYLIQIEVFRQIEQAPDQMMRLRLMNGISKESNMKIISNGNEITGSVIS